MNKYEIKYMLEQAMSSVDRLTDTTGKQSLHIEKPYGTPLPNRGK